jgi:NADH:ubiquinone oxidoreductase subunit E
LADVVSIENFDVVKEIIEKRKGTQGCLMMVLQDAQEAYGYLPLEIQEVIAEGLDVPLTEVYGVATFYSQFTLTPKGEYTIGVCLGTACYVRGSQDIIDEISDQLKIGVGETSKDGKFTLEATRCIGACGLAPVLTVNEDVYGRLEVGDSEDILKKYM